MTLAVDEPLNPPQTNKIIRNDLQTYGFMYVWNNQVVSNGKLFISQYSQRLTDIFLHAVREMFEKSTKCILYKNSVDTFKLQEYLCKPLSAVHEKMLCKYRISWIGKVSSFTQRRTKMYTLSIQRNRGRIPLCLNMSIFWRLKKKTHTKLLLCKPSVFK